MNKKFVKKGTFGKTESCVDKKKKNLIKAVKIIVIAFVVLVIVVGLLGVIENSLKKRSEKDAENTEINLNADGKNYINYYEPDYSVNIFEDDDYLKENRKIRYTFLKDNSKNSIILDEYKASLLNEAQRFFIAYFDTVISGNYEEYPKLFTKEYIDDPKGFEKHPDRKFPMQRIYDITISELLRTDPSDTSYTYGGKNAVFGVYEVSYKILKNDGEFRVDLPENGEIPLIFELVTTGHGTENEITLIKDIYKYSDIN